LKTQPKNIQAATIMLISWLLLSAAIPTYAFFWRVDNEPGAKKIPELLWAAVCFLSSGGLLFISTNIYLIIQRSKLIFITWGLCLIITIMACSLSPVLLLFMV